MNAYTEINLTKLDILDTFPEIKVAVNYLDPHTKQKVDGFPADLQQVDQLDVEYVTLPGWMKPIGEARNFSDLPEAVRCILFDPTQDLLTLFKQCQKYVEFIEENVGVK